MREEFGLLMGVKTSPPRPSQAATVGEGPLAHGTQLEHADGAFGAVYFLSLAVGVVAMALLDGTATGAAPSRRCARRQIRGERPH